MHKILSESYELAMSKVIFILVLVCISSTYAQWGKVPQYNDIKFKHISAGMGFLWGVNQEDDIYFCERPCKEWKKTDGKLMQIDVGDSEVWGVSASHAIWKRPSDNSADWRRVPGALKHVSASGNGFVWGVNKNDDIFFCKKPCNGQWQKIDGKLRQVDAGYKYVYGVNSNDYIFARPVDGSGRWRRIPGKLRHISASGADDVFGVNKEQHMWRCKKPCIGDWERMGIPFRAQQCDATSNELLAVENNGAGFYRLGIQSH